MQPPRGTTIWTGAVACLAARARTIGAIMDESIPWVSQGMAVADAATVFEPGQIWVEPRSGVMSETAKLTKIL
eukprot:SAG31_NODE_15080_length_772_cov_0.554235_1_plen_73_part_00